MGRKCCVPGCKSNYATSPGYVNVFSFPKDLILKEKWIRQINGQYLLYNKKITKGSAVCIKHFDESVIIREHRVTRPDGSLLIELRKAPVLKEGAYPTIFESQPAYTTSKTTKEQKTPEEGRALDLEKRSDEMFTQSDSSEEVGRKFKKKSQQIEGPSKKSKKSESTSTSSSTESAQSTTIVPTTVTPNFQTAASSAKTFNPGTPIILTSQLQSPGPFFFLQTQPKSSLRPAGPFLFFLTQPNSSKEVGLNFKMKSIESQQNKGPSKESELSKSFVTSSSTSTTESAQPIALVQAAVTSNFPTATSRAETFNLGTAKSSSLRSISPDSVLPDVSPKLLVGADFENSSNLTEDTVLDPQIIIKQEIIETEEDMLDFSPFLQSSSDGHSRFQTQKSENYQEGVKKLRQNSPIAYSSKCDLSENSEAFEANHSQDPFNAFGLFVASKLRNLDRKSCAFVQKSIADLLFEAEWGLFLTPQEKTCFEKKNDSIIKRLHETVADTSSVGPSS